VAARYAKAPSYSQMLAAEAPAAPPAGEVAAPTAADSSETDGFSAVTGPRFWDPDAPPVLAAAPTDETDWEPTLPPPHSPVPSTLEDWENGLAHNHMEPDLRLRPMEAVPATVAVPASALADESEPAPTEEFAPSPYASSAPDSTSRAKWEWPELAREFSINEETEPVEPDAPIHANLIEFPRELVATRKVRARRAEGPFAAKPESQLSIFEVDPRAVSTRPDTAAAAAIAAWPEPAWAEIELEPQAHEEPEPGGTPVAQSELELAPINRRVVAALTDCLLIAGVVLVPALVAAEKFGYPRPVKIVELGAVLALLLAGMLYHAFFLTLGGVTPGMRFAGISLCTFDGQIPTRKQLRGRWGALLLSLVPVGLGIAWAIFDEDHLSWHDRLSKTYLREN
jgi:uncharacterized RDD family membrane protein YckC